MGDILRAKDPDFNQLRAEVDARGGVMTVQMERIRNDYGAGRLGVHVRDGISKALHGAGLGHYPDEGLDGSPLVGDQWAPVRIYRLGSPIAEFIDAVLNPSEAHDEELRKAAGGDESDTLLVQRVRELVCG